MEKVVSYMLKARFVKQFHLDEELPSDVLNNLQIVYLEKNEKLYHQDNKLECIYFLLQGKLQVDSYIKDGSQTIFSFETPFSILGDLELFEDMRILSNVTAVESCYLFALSKTFLRSHVYDNPVFLRFIIRHIRKKLNYSASMLNKNAQTLEVKLASYLLEKMKFEGIDFTLENRESIASMFGVSPRHLNRVLKSFKERGIIIVNRNKVKIIQPFTLNNLF